MRWSFAIFALLSACSLPAATPPPQGAYGYVRQDDEDAMGGVEGLGICALNTINAKGTAVDSTTLQTITDVNGNFTIALPGGTATTGTQYELCLIDGGQAVKCDCPITIFTGSQFNRYFLREATYDESPAHWQGQWYGANAQSSCNFMLAD